MRNYKKLAAITMAATMLAGSCLTAFAADENEGGDTGNGKYEGYVDETSVFSAVVPTDAGTTSFDFFIDPNGLLGKTGYKSLGEGVTEEKFEAGASLFFTRAETDSVKKYGKDSDSVKFVNKSSYDVNVEVFATVTGADGIELSEEADVSNVENPTLYLAIVQDADSSPDTEVITTTGGLLTGIIEGEPDNFEIKYDQGKYVYAESDGVQEEDWNAYSFHLTGACGGKWTDKQADAAPVINLTWKVTDPNAEVGPSIRITEYNYDRTQTLEITTNFGNGEPAATSIKKVAISNDGRTNITDLTSKCKLEGNKITFPANQWGGASVGNNRYIHVTFDEGTEVILTMNITK